MPRLTDESLDLGAPLGRLRSFSRGYLTAGNAWADADPALLAARLRALADANAAAGGSLTPPVEAVLATLERGAEADPDAIEALIRFGNRAAAGLAGPAGCDGGPFWAACARALEAAGVDHVNDLDAAPAAVAC